MSPEVLLSCSSWAFFFFLNIPCESLQGLRLVLCSAGINISLIGRQQIPFFFSRPVRFAAIPRNSMLPAEKEKEKFPAGLEWICVEPLECLKKETADICPPNKVLGAHRQYIQGIAAGNVKPTWGSKAEEER